MQKFCCFVQNPILLFVALCKGRETILSRWADQSFIICLSSSDNESLDDFLNFTLVVLGTYNKSFHEFNIFFYKIYLFEA